MQSKMKNKDVTKLHNLIDQLNQCIDRLSEEDVVVKMGVTQNFEHEATTKPYLISVKQITTLYDGKMKKHEQDKS